MIIKSYSLGTCICMCLIALVTMICGCKASRETLEPISLHLDQNIWLVDTPSMRAAMVWFGRPHVLDDCSERAVLNESAVPQQTNTMTLAKSCKYTHILFSRGWVDALSARSKKIIAIHESFHVLAQMDAPMKMRFDYAYAEPRDELSVDRAHINKFYSELINALNEQENAKACGLIHAEYGQLNANEKIVVNFKSQLEWPAEYYMVKKANLNQKEYLEFRFKEMKFTPADWLYVAGYYGFKKISSRYEPSEWQKRYQDGESVLNMLNESMGCNQNLVAFTAPSIITLSVPNRLYGP